MAVQKITVNGKTINVTSLDPDMVKKVEAMMKQPNGYSKALALSKTFRDQVVSQRKVAPVGNTTVSGGTTDPGTVTANMGDVTVDKGVVSDGAVQRGVSAEIQDANYNFQANNPTSQTDSFGNTQNITQDPLTGKTTIKQGMGTAGTAATSAFLGSAGSLSLDRNKAQNAAYGYISQNYAKQKADEMTAKKQELAERGIPMGSQLYNQQISDIDQKYQRLDDQAKNQGILAGSEYLNSSVNAFGSLAGTAKTFGPNFTPYQGTQVDTSGTMGSFLSQVSDSELAAIGLDQQKLLALKQLEETKRANKVREGLAGRTSGGSGGGSSDSGILIGGNFV